jgi:hypothetical protein
MTMTEQTERRSARSGRCKRSGGQDSQQTKFHGETPYQWEVWPAQNPVAPHGCTTNQGL